MTDKIYLKDIYVYRRGGIMGIKEKSIATLWSKHKGKGNYIVAKVSTRKKRSDTGTYITDFKGDVRLIEKQKNYRKNANRER